MTAQENGSRRGGRPTKEAARQLGNAMRDAALAQFLEHGYEATSMDAIAAAAGTTKATLYGRFSSKSAIFQDVLEWAVQRRDWPEPEPELPSPDDLDHALREIARVAVRRATHPAMVRLARIAVAEINRFPELARTFAAPTWPRRQFVTELLERHAAALALPGPAEVVAELFLGFVSSPPARLASFGITQDEATLAAHTELSVTLFLRGLRP